MVRGAVVAATTIGAMSNAFGFSGDPRRAFVFDGRAMRQRRINAGLSLTDMAYAVDRSVASIVHWQNGRTVPPTKALLKICEVLDCEPDALFRLVEGFRLVEYQKKAKRKQELVTA
jgi:transcriptional regulator with XRE-family HTH domain